ncbi:SMP-30/gluconolactonase/LRE family protein [Paraburkholderia sediminicola]|uniref:SMP-30/gluconolactonase/LRE family protein n=1 Tax=Paraburkholderia sediminicola TaxID=458836 RepID=UPI0038BB0A0B
MKEHQATLVADGFVFLEAPRWYDNRLWVSDVFDFKLYTVSEDGTRSVVCNVPGRPAGIGFLPDKTPIVVSCADKKLMKVSEGVLSVYADLTDFAPGDLNDLVVDDMGRAYVGNFGYDLFGGAPVEATDMHVVEPDGSIRVAATGLEFPNGAVIKDDGRTLVVAETWSGKLTAYDRAVNGDLSHRRLFADLGGRQPDGICVDKHGAIWAGCYNTGEFIRVIEGGEVTDRVKFEGNAVSCAMGGRNGTTLYCCVYLGTDEQLQARQPHSAIYKAELAA